jgi:ketosteroid isomerase-like protein
MDVRELAADYAALVAGGHMDEAARKYWSDDIVTREPVPGQHSETHGRDHALEKAHAWADTHEIHGFRTEGPFVNGDTFLILMEMDVTPRGGGERLQMREVVGYRVADGKVVEERYYY